jgi:hypothetical protein
LERGIEVCHDKRQVHLHPTVILYKLIPVSSGFVYHEGRDAAKLL